MTNKINEEIVIELKIQDDKKEETRNSDRKRYNIIRNI